MEVSCQTVYPTVAYPLNSKLLEPQNTFRRGREEKNLF
jgi:hypothetical protein